MSNVRIFKMVSGEEVLARVEEIDENTYQFSKARAIMVAGVQQGGLQISFIPWTVTDPDGAYPVEKDRVMCEPNLSQELEMTYLNETSDIALK